MAGSDNHDHTARNVALVGGGVLLVWLLLRGKGFGLGDGGGFGPGGGGGTATPSTSPNGPARAPCRVWIRSAGIEVDGAPADLPAVVARCRAAGRAEVNASGAAITGVIADVIRSLQAAGVGVSAPPDVWTALGATPERRP